MSRLVFDPLPADTVAPLRRVLDAAMRSIREILEGGWRWREQVQHVKTVTLAGDDLPLSLAFDGLLSPPVCVLMLSAVEADSGTGIVISGGAVTWSFANGAVVLSGLSEITGATRYQVTLAAME
jgi:hypothetical protein